MDGMTPMPRPSALRPWTHRQPLASGGRREEREAREERETPTRPEASNYFLLDMGNSGDYIDRQASPTAASAAPPPALPLLCVAGQQAESHPQGPSHVHGCIHAPDEVSG